MERITRIFNKEFSQISEAALVLGFFTLLSQVLGIFRDRFLAGNIGAGSTLDIYYAAFRIPDLLFTFGAALVSVSILMPFLKTQLEKSKEQGKQFIYEIFTVFFLSISVLALVAWIIMPEAAVYLFPGFSGDELAETIMLSRIMLLSPILLGVSNLFATITQSFKKFYFRDCLVISTLWDTWIGIWSYSRGSLACVDPITGRDSAWFISAINKKY